MMNRGWKRGELECALKPALSLLSHCLTLSDSRVTDRDCTLRSYKAAAYCSFALGERGIFEIELYGLRSW